MKIAVIPTELSWLNNKAYADKWMRFTDIDNILRSRKNGSQIVLVSSVSDMLDADWIVFVGWYSWSYKWYKIVLKNKLENKTVYWMLEPEVVNKQHSLYGSYNLLQKFKYIMTWNCDLIDSKRIFRLNNLYNWKMNVDINDIGNDLCNEKALLTNISGNKISDVKGELYSERYKVIQWFEKNHPEDFKFYGSGWEDNNFKTNGGACRDKKEVYVNFKFALCLENVAKKDFVSEKIIDCLTYGIVPIYKGAENITDYIPKGCFIDYNKFNDINELYSFIKNMSDEEYDKYIHNIREFLLNTDEISIFSAQEWVNRFDLLSRYDKGSFTFEVNFSYRIRFYLDDIIFSIKLLKHRLINRILKK